uniref:hypothetical protein n=1 Tax=Amycolatopsis sp. CA-096443 TaxID=3239919 RepID=UPI003F492522
MGANEFVTYQSGVNAEEAFRTAVADAQLWHGSGGRTGTIAEKAAEGFVIVSAEPVSEATAEKTAARVLAGDDEQWAEIRDKRGPAGGIAVAGGQREHQVTIPAVPGGHADLEAAVVAAMSGKLAEGEFVVYREVSGEYRSEGTRVLGGRLTVPTMGARTQTGWLWFGNAPR